MPTARPTADIFNLISGEGDGKLPAGIIGDIVASMLNAGNGPTLEELERTIPLNNAAIAATTSPAIPLGPVIDELIWVAY